MEKATTIYLARHCPYANPKNVIPFRLPGFPLSQSGKECAQKLAEYFADKSIDQIFTSPLTRTQQTATIIGGKLHQKPIISDLINETRTPLQGMDKSLFEAQGGDALTHPEHIKKNGETAQQIFSRVKRLIDQVINKHPQTNTILVSHGDPIMLSSQGLLGKTLSGSIDPHYIPMGGVLKLSYQNKNWITKRIIY